MVDLRTLLAAVLGFVLGIGFLTQPDAVIRAYTAGRRPHDQGGKYGTSGTASDRWRNIVRLVGVANLLFSLYFASVVVRSLG